MRLTEDKMKYLPMPAPVKASRRALFVSLFAISSLLGGATSVPAAQHSQLWGERGEHWTPQSRLPDFSFAGYQRGEKPLPDLPPGVSVKKFGAKGDGQADDTAAFRKALTEVKSGAIEVPPGRYRITGLLEITRPNVVLRGAGPDRTVLFFPTPLNDIKSDWGATTGGRKTSNYSWSGGFITLHGSFQSRKLTEISPAQPSGATGRSTSRPQPGCAWDRRLKSFNPTHRTTRSRCICILATPGRLRISRGGPAPRWCAGSPPSPATVSRWIARCGGRCGRNGSHSCARSRRR